MKFCKNKQTARRRPINSMFYQSKHKRKIMVIFISMFIFVQFFGLLLFVGPVKTEGVPVVVTGSVPETTKEIKATIGAQLLNAALGSLLHAATYFMRRLAYDTATYLATGGKGQGALIFQDGAGTYFSNLGKNAAADAIDQIGKPFGLNLCENPNLDFQVFMKIGLRSLYVDYWGGVDVPEPSCDWQNLKLRDHWETYTAGVSAEQAFTNALQFENTDFGITLGAIGKIDRIQQVEQMGAEIERLEGKGFKAVTELVTGKVMTPADMVAEESKLVTNKGQSEMTMGQVAGVYGVSSLQLIPMAASVFLNTFMSQGLKTLQEKLLTLGQDGANDEDLAGLLSFESAGFQSNRQKAQAVFSSILTVNIQQLNNYPLLEEFSSCPDPPLKPGLNNCVMDMGLRNVLELARQGNALTIREAIEQKGSLLHGDWPLISPKRIADNTNKDCYLNGYCYSNLQKLRRSRILPLGFEIAAYLADPDDPEEKWTLEKVMNGFEDCKYINGVVVPDFAGHPYCHLIDPNWILKMPDTRCNAKVYSSNLTDTNSGNRAEECVDAPARLKTQTIEATIEEDNFGYCTREKNVWKLGGDVCEAQYNTCTTFTSSNGKMSSYLARTVDYGECNLSNTGCLAYSTEKSGDQWKASKAAQTKQGIEYKREGRNQTLYFNEKIKNYTCSSGDNGCTGFYLGALTDGGYINNYNEKNLIYLKKAPDYLDCYDINPATPAIDWPQTKPELQKIKSDEDERCDKFAGVCLPEEVECDSYVSVNEPNPLAIPAVVGSKNYCNQACVGYDTFKQSVTNFAPAEFPLYFIPSNGESCAGVYSGCDEFTNIDVQAKGGESLEYYTDLKYCERPSGQNESTFYSWEGSKDEGYVLKTHKLRPLTKNESDYLKTLTELKLNAGDVLAEIFSVGSPAYASDSLDELQLAYNLCNESGYNQLVNGFAPGFNGTASVDCRALYDKNGKVFYRLLADTITISESCHPLRKTLAYLYTDNNIKDSKFCVEQKKGVWSDDVCQRCTNGGFYENGACVYWAISKPSEAESCLPSAVGCREYKGNAGNNLKWVWQTDFTPESNETDALNKAKSGWLPELKYGLNVVQEAVQVGGYSLQVDYNEVYYKFEPGVLEAGKLYTLSFWTRGIPQKLSVYFRQDDKIVGNQFTYDQPHNQNINLSVGAEWREFKLGPVQFVGDSAKPVELVFVRDHNVGPYYLDNLRLLRVDDVYYLIKDSWKTAEGNDAPAVCYNQEGIPTDPYPGEALGCKLYKEESTGQEKALVGFEKMCREEAVGCRAMFDTYNTEEEYMTVYNAWCALKPGQINKKCELQEEIDGETKVLGSCTIEAGASGCYVDRITLFNASDLSGDWIKKSTVVVPADTPSDKPIYLTQRSEFQCKSTSKGCQELGAETQVLPTDAGDNSNALTFSDVNPVFLNDPSNYVGPDGTLCRDDLVGCGEFKNENNLYYFKDPQLTGNSWCEYKEKTTVGNVSFYGWFKKDVGFCSDNDKKICRENGDCGLNATCEDIGTVPCYSNYMFPGGEYGVWSNDTKDKYQGMVGLCPDNKNGCREFVDPADTSELNPKGQSYYVVYNEKMKEKENVCNGQVSLKEGCVLFNKTDEPNLNFDSVATYKKSAENNPKYGLVGTESTEKNDTNHILKVERDRECAEWLSCKGYLPVINKASGESLRNVCYALELCQEGDNFSCVSAVDQQNYEGKALNYNNYIKRDVSWSTGREFSGYSVFNELFLSNFSFVNQSDDYYMAYVDKDDISCKDKAPGEKCGTNGYCLNQKCVYPLNGSYAKGVDKENFINSLSSRECRGYPKTNSPFLAKDIVKEWQNGRPLTYAPSYESAKVCQPGQNCDCDYTEVGYGISGTVSETLYFNTSTLPIGICQGGEKDGLSVTSESECGDLGTYLTMQKKQENSGWKGYCLERDISRRINASVGNAPEGFACLTWYPLESVPDTEDLYSSDPEGLGYAPPANSGQAYCTEMLGFANLHPDLSVPCDLSNSTLTDEFKENYSYWWKESAWFSAVQEPTVMIMGNKDCYAESLTSEGISNFCKADLMNDLNFSDVQKMTNLFIRDIYPKFDIVDLVPDTQIYISRIDVAARPLSAQTNTWLSNFFSNVVDAASDGTWWKNSIFYENSLIEHRRKQMALLAGATMSTQGAGGKPYIPLFPDAEVFDEDGTWHLSGIAKPNAIKESEAQYYTNNGYGTPHSHTNSEFHHEPNVIGNSGQEYTGYDTGIWKQSPNKAESFISKDMVEAVTIVPMWPSENGDDHASSKFIPGPMTIKLDADYLSYPASTNSDSSTKPEFIVSGSGYWNKYWVLKTDHTDEDGYVLQWFTTDPAGLVGTDSMKGDGFPAYADTYIVNPLEAGTIDCSKETDYSENSHFLAVEILFDKKTGKFTGYRSRNCMRIDGAQWGYATAVVFHLKPMCAEAVKVYDENQDKIKNKAWTDRLWEGSEFGKTYWGDKIPKNAVIKNDPNVPFGSIKFDKNLENYTWVNTYKVPKEDEANAGRPWTCLMSFMDSKNTTYNEICSVMNYPSIDTGGIKEEKIYKFQINELFAKVFTVYNKLDVTGKVSLWTSTDLVKLNKTFTESGTEDYAYTKGKPPYIYPAINCKGEGLIRKCSVDVNNVNNFAINGASGKKPDDRLFGKKNYTAVMEFFAWADHNQMPIRRILVDWQEYSSWGTQAGNMYGYYPNTKPFCANGGNAKECTLAKNTFGLTCEENFDCPITHTCETTASARFGNQLNSSCFETPMLRVFNYTCNNKNADTVLGGPELDSTSDWYKFLKVKGYEDGNKFCMFQPKVQILDNWGWCTGSCAGDQGSDGRLGCYNGIKQKCDTEAYDPTRFLTYSNIIVVAPQ